VREHYEYVLSTSNVKAGFSVKNPATQQTWHYILKAPATTTATITIYDEDFQTIKVVNLGVVNPAMEVMTPAILDNEIVIGSPSFPQMYGLVGSDLIQSVKVESVNAVNTTAIEVPRGICIHWAGRIVVSDGRSVYFSDALYPRTYVAENVLVAPGGNIYGMHVSAGGALVLCTSTGVWALPEDASASGQIVLGVWSKLSDFETVDYLSTCVSNGVIYGLSKYGWRAMESANSKELVLSEQKLSRSNFRIEAADFRPLARIFGGIHGPIVGLPTPHVHATDVANGVKSWWTFPASSDVICGVLYDDDGEEMLLTGSGIMRRCGNQTGYESSVIGMVAGRIPSPPEASPVLRYVTLATDGESSTTVMVNNVKRTLSAYTGKAPLIGTTAWGSGVYREVPMRSRQADFAERGDEVAVEIAVYEHPSRVADAVDLEFKGPGRKRPTG
jgi:hypothetical protein